MIPRKTCGIVRIVGPMSNVNPSCSSRFIFPPRCRLVSTTVTRSPDPLPALESSAAAASPANPPPITTT
jgi:hypothetical protein